MLMQKTWEGRANAAKALKIRADWVEGLEGLKVTITNLETTTAEWTDHAAGNLFRLLME
jgi:hypothetical protein